MKMKTKKLIEKVKNEIASEKRNEKLYFVQFGQVRRHSRILYIPLDVTTVRLHRIKKGDIIKYQLLELRRAPEEDEEIHDPGELEES
jgi:hypothetical protein